MKANQDFLFLTETTEDAERIFRSPVRDLKNVLVVVASTFSSSFQLFSSGIFEGKRMTKVAANTSLGIGKLFKSKFSDMKGYTFRVAALAYPPYLMKNGDKYSGYEILQLEAMGSMLNFTYKTIEPPDGQ